MSLGRGGAGNIEAQQRQRAEATADIEAQRPANATLTTNSDSTLPEYAYTGRGGVGNIYSPRELASTGDFSKTEGSTAQPTDGRRSSAAPNQQDGAPPIRKVGRGGAGNYEYGSSHLNESKSKAQEEESLQREIQSIVEQDVNEQLPMPPKARILTAGVYRG